MFKYKFGSALNRNVLSKNKSIFAILSKCYKMNLPIDIQLELFDKVIEPTLLYGCEVWALVISKE